MEGFSWRIKRQLETKKEAKANGNGNEIITGVRGRKGVKGGRYGHYNVVNSLPFTWYVIQSCTLSSTRTCSVSISLEVQTGGGPGPAAWTRPGWACVRQPPKVKFVHKLHNLCCTVVIRVRRE
jgi:hypothetical protein